MLPAGEPMNSSNPTFQRGVTLSEIVIALSVLIITLSLAAPDFASFIQQVRLSSAVNELHNAIVLTRTEAVSRNDIVDLIALNNDWKNGWRISAADNQQILAHEALHVDFKIESRFGDGLQHVAYNGTGHSVRAHGSTAAPQSGHIKLSLGAHSRIIIVNFLGRTRICNPSQDKYCDSASSD